MSAYETPSFCSVSKVMLETEIPSKPSSPTKPSEIDEDSELDEHLREIIRKLPDPTPQPGGE